MHIPRFSHLLALCPLAFSSCTDEASKALTAELLNTAIAAAEDFSTSPSDTFAGEILEEARIVAMMPAYYIHPQLDAAISEAYYVTYSADRLPGDLDWYDSNLPYYRNSEILEKMPKDKLMRIFQAYKKKADDGNPQSQINVGSFYWKGYGIPKNEELALSYFRKATEQTQNTTCRQIGLFDIRYVQLCGEKCSFDQCLMEFRTDKDSSEAAYENGELLYLLDTKKAKTPREHAAVLAELKPRAQTDTTGSSSYIMGMACEQGIIGMKVDKKAALEYYKQAAQMSKHGGYAEAQLALGNIYMLGKRLGQQANPALALEYYQKAVPRHGDSQLDTANHYARARLAVYQLLNPKTTLKVTLEPGSPAVAINPELMLKEAAQEGDIEAAYNYGMLMLARSGGVLSEEALSLIRTAGEYEGNESTMLPAKAAALVVDALVSGQGSEDDMLKKAVEVLRKDKSPAAQVLLGNCYASGTGVPRNIAEAFRLYEKHQNACPAACYNLGLCYESGAGTAPNAELGAELKQKAMRKLKQR